MQYVGGFNVYAKHMQKYKKKQFVCVFNSQVLDKTVWYRLKSSRTVVLIVHAPTVSNSLSRDTRLADSASSLLFFFQSCF